VTKGHCVQDCNYCDRSKPIEDVLPQDATEVLE